MKVLRDLDATAGGIPEAMKVLKILESFVCFPSCPAFSGRAAERSRAAFSFGGTKSIHSCAAHGRKHRFFVGGTRNCARVWNAVCFSVSK